jgi:GMP synthase (glutamine-hydrolysing)
MAIMVLQHGVSGGPGRLGCILRDRGYTLDIRRADLAVGTGVGGVPLDLDDVQGLVVLGGEQNVTDIGRYPWMQDEVALVRKAHAAGLPVVGICLGAQVIAHALGGTVGAKDAPECGFAMMDVTVAGQTETLMAGVPWKSPQLFYCGQEVKTLPAGAMALASTGTMKVAAFKVGLRTYGYLCHFEHDRAAAEESAACVCGTGGVKVDMGAQMAKHYETFARVSERVCGNIAAYLMPESRRLVG